MARRMTLPTRRKPFVSMLGKHQADCPCCRAERSITYTFQRHDYKIVTAEKACSCHIPQDTLISISEDDLLKR